MRVTVLVERDHEVGFLEAGGKVVAFDMEEPGLEAEGVDHQAALVAFRAIAAMAGERRPRVARVVEMDPN